MSDFLKRLADLDWVGISTALAGACASVAALVVSIINARKTSVVRKALQDAKMRETYTVCPHCKKRVPLSDLPFYLPDGNIDQDLDGKPDE